MPVNVPAHGDPVLRELVPVGNGRDHSIPSYWGWFRVEA